MGTKKEIDFNSFLGNEKGLLERIEALETEHHWSALSPYWMRWKTQQQLPPCLLLTGPLGIGKKVAARAWVQACLCEQEERHALERQGLGCGLCSPCKAFQGEGSWENGFLKTWFQPALEEVRSLENFLRVPAYGNPPFFLLLPEVHRLSLPILQALLKILEEPPSRSCFILTSLRSESLPLALQSRCQKLTLIPFSKKQLQEKGQKVGLTAQGSLFAQGSVRRGLWFQQPEWGERHALLKAMIQTPDKAFDTLPVWVSLEGEVLSSLVGCFQVWIGALLGQIGEQNPFKKGGQGAEELLIAPFLAQWKARGKTILELQKTAVEWGLFLEHLQGELEGTSNRKRLFQEFLMRWMAPWM